MPWFIQISKFPSGDRITNLEGGNNGMARVGHEMRK
jgi:hypothetical protein